MKYEILFSSENVYKKWYDSSRTNVDVINNDINLDAVAEQVLKTSSGFPVQIFLYPCNDINTTKLRAEIFRELYEKPSVCESLREYIQQLIKLKKQKQDEFNSPNPIQKQQYFLTSVLSYINCIERLAEIISSLKSKAFVSLYNKFNTIITSPEYGKMKIKAENLYERVDNLLGMSLSFDIRNSAVGIRENKSGVMVRLSELYENLIGTKLNPGFSIVNSNPISALEEDIINVLKLRSPETFEELAEFYNFYAKIKFFDIIELKEQLHFYLDYIDFVKQMQTKGFHFTLPVFTDNNLNAVNAYDLSLAVKLSDSEAIVSNDISLSKGNLFVLSGPNQGGKTTFVRSVAQNIVLAQNGCFVAAEKYETPYFDILLTHFNHSETLGHGRLEEELERIREMLSRLTPDTFVLFNECFMSTRRIDGVELSLKLFDKLFEIGCSGGFVTHYYEIAEKDERLRSFVAGVKTDGDKDDIRTYKISECPPKSTAYARSIAEKCGITFERLQELINNEKA
ncbi:MAG: hypothetical protein A2Y17_01335 [Clostridiales bacterium GWF2_38_85]|nr:MAG: hypothetical protein A2Y17_01335 [Clostridiales bacterium GWF2_38_85]HBL85163.1 hypothetical protein [Clostridiales bacterium]